MSCAYCSGKIIDGFCEKCGAAAHPVTSAEVVKRVLPEHFEHTVQCETCRTSFKYTAQNVIRLTYYNDIARLTETMFEVHGQVACPVCQTTAWYTLYEERIGSGVMQFIRDKAGVILAVIALILAILAYHYP